MEHKIFHDCEELALDEALFQDQASCLICLDGKEGSWTEGRVCATAKSLGEIRISEGETRSQTSLSHLGKE